MLVKYFLQFRKAKKLVKKINLRKHSWLKEF